MELALNTPQYFFDDSVIARQQRLVRRWQPAKTFRRPIIRADKPWEARILALYGTVFQRDDGSYRMYYSNLPVPKGLNGEYAKVFVADSRDGFCWEKPELGIVDWHGDRRNNVLIAPSHTLDAPSVAFDPGEEYPYKLMVYEGDSASGAGLFGYRSRDGLRFERLPGPLLATGDRTNMMSRRTDGKYVVYTRHRDMMRLTGTRSIYRAVSDDFRSWTEPELVLRPDLVDEPEVEYYGMSVFLRHGWYLGLLEYWHSEIDRIETYLAFSRDGINWKHPEPRRPFIPAQFDWNHTWTSCASNGPIIMNEQMVFYFGGRWVSHHFDSAQQEGVIGYASLPVDRFCALEATTGGLLETESLQWPGGDLSVNADTRPFYDSHPAHTRGEMSVEVLDRRGEPLVDWCGEHKARFSGNTVSRCQLDPGIVRWPGNVSLSKLGGQTIRLRFNLDYGRLYTFQAV